MIAGDRPLGCGLTRKSAYISLPPRPSDLDVTARTMTALSFRDWQHHPDRKAYETLDDDRLAVAQIICWIARPDRPEISLRHLQAFSNLMVRTATGQPHPRFADAPRKKKVEVLKPFLSLERRFLRALTAARMLEHAWNISGGSQNFGSSLQKIAPEHVAVELPPESDERKKRWSDYRPCIHLALTVRTALIKMGVDVDARQSEEGLILLALLNGGERQAWVSAALLEAERWSYRLYFQGIFDPAHRMNRFKLRPRELIGSGDFFPVKR